MIVEFSAIRGRVRSKIIRGLRMRDRILPQSATRLPFRYVNTASYGVRVHSFVDLKGRICGVLSRGVVSYFARLGSPGAWGNTRGLPTTRIRSSFAGEWL